MAQGFVYILINPSIPGYMKIGKTTKHPEDRAKELSTATGVPTSFVLAYYTAFADCDRAEAYIHTLLESRGISRTPNREFFAMDLRKAIAVFMEAERNFKCDPDAPAGITSANAAESDIASEEPVWKEVLRQAWCYDYGDGDFIQDKNRAIELYKQAARLGASEAYIRLAELAGNDDEGIRWLTRGAESGMLDCWAELAWKFSGTGAGYTPNQRPHAENARKAWRQFFRSVEPASYDADYDAEGSRLYTMLRDYVALTRLGRPDPEDIKVIRAFEARFTHALEQLPNENDRRTKLAELQKLMSSLP
jgi:hypothetical protein